MARSFPFGCFFARSMSRDWMSAGFTAFVPSVRVQGSAYRPQGDSISSGRGDEPKEEIDYLADNSPRSDEQKIASVFVDRPTLVSGA